VRVRIVGVILDIDNNGLVLVTDWSIAAASIPGLEATAYEVLLKPGTDPLRYATALQHDAGADIVCTFDARPARTHRVDTAFRALIGLILALGLILVVVAGIGVFNTTLLDVRERACQIAILKAAGMSPGQVVGLTLRGIAVIGALAGLAGLLAGIALHHVILQRMAAIAGERRAGVVLCGVHPGFDGRSNSGRRPRGARERRPAGDLGGRQPGGIGAPSEC
jgi:putative ABC transport system permease protein